MVSCSDRRGLASGGAPQPPLLITHLCISPQNQWTDPSLRPQPWIKSGLVESPLGSVSSLGPAFCRQQGPVKLKCLVSLPGFLKAPPSVVEWLIERTAQKTGAIAALRRLQNQQWTTQKTSFSFWRRESRGCCCDALVQISVRTPSLFCNYQFMCLPLGLWKSLESFHFCVHSAQSNSISQVVTYRLFGD